MKRKAVLFFKAFSVITLVSVTVAMLEAYFQTNNRDVWEDYIAYKKGYMLKHNFSERDLTLKKFNIAGNGSDVIVHMQIQKTGSTFLEGQLHFNMDLSAVCNYPTQQKNKKCLRKWHSHVLMGSDEHRFPCGVHADWTVLKGCVHGLMNRLNGRKMPQRHIFITTVRDPLRRYLSEWKVVAKGSRWPTEKVLCKGRGLHIPKCYKTRVWLGVSLADFMNCSSNLAINRMTRMLANLSIDDCYRNMTYEEKHFRMLESAKENLKSMDYFGLTGYQELSQILFENTFNLKFKTKHHTDLDQKTLSGNARLNISENVKQAILHLNRFDVILYQFAKDLFFQRLRKLSQTTTSNSLREHIRRLTQSMQY